MKFRRVKGILLAAIVLAVCSCLYWLLFVSTHESSSLSDLEQNMGDGFPHTGDDDLRGIVVGRRGHARRGHANQFHGSKLSDSQKLSPKIQEQIDVADAKKGNNVDDDRDINIASKYGDTIARKDNAIKKITKKAAAQTDSSDELEMIDRDDDYKRHSTRGTVNSKDDGFDFWNRDDPEKSNVVTAQKPSTLRTRYEDNEVFKSNDVIGKLKPEANEPARRHDQELADVDDDGYVLLDNERPHRNSIHHLRNKFVPEVTRSNAVNQEPGNMANAKHMEQFEKLDIELPVVNGNGQQQQALHVDGVQASHVRSHGIAPIPRVYGSALTQPAPNRPFIGTKRPSLGDIVGEDFFAAPQRDVGNADELASSLYFLVHNGRASKASTLKHAKLRAMPDHVLPESYIFTSKSLPEDVRLRPSIGNGFLATVAHGASVFMSGLYNGEGDQSHRAAIPSTCSFTISGTEPEMPLNKTYQLNVGEGIYSEITTGPSFVITQRIYVHRSLSSLIVVEVDLDRSDIGQPLKLKTKLNRWTLSYDFTFLKEESKDPEVSYKRGTLHAKESAGSPDKEVHVLYDHIPDELVPPQGARRVKWIFLSAIALSKHEVELFYEAGAEHIHTSDELYASHVRAWASIWARGRVDVTGDLALARAAYSSLYYLLSSVPLKYRPHFVGLSPSGLPLGDSGQDYEGRVMYDQELWMYPALLSLHADLSYHLILSRLDLASAARSNALSAGKSGAMYPWYSGADGLELSQDVRRGFKSPYVSAGVVFAALQHVYATNRTADITNTSLGTAIADICHFLLTKVHVIRSGGYAVLDVLPLDDSHGLVNNSAFVNAIMKQALSTLGYVYSLENKTTVDFGHFADGIVIPLQDSYHPAYEGYQATTTVQQMDAVLLGYPLQLPMGRRIRLNDLRNYEMVTSAATSPMTWAMFAIGWLEVDERQKADLAFRKQLTFIQNDFQVWSSTPKFSKNSAYNYLSAMGAFQQSLINGYGGVRLNHGRLDLNPVLPIGVTSLSYTGLDYLGSHIDISVSTSEISVKVTSAELGAPLLKVYVHNPEEIHTLQQAVEVKFQRRRAAIFSADGPLPPSVAV